MIITVKENIRVIIAFSSVSPQKNVSHGDQCLLQQLLIYIYMVLYVVIYIYMVRYVVIYIHKSSVVFDIDGNCFARI